MTPQIKQHIKELIPLLEKELLSEANKNPISATIIEKWFKNPYDEYNNDNIYTKCNSKVINLADMISELKSLVGT